MISRLRLARYLATTAVACLAAASSAAAHSAARGDVAHGDVTLRRILETRLAGVEQAGRLAAGGSGGSTQVQAQYDAARDFEQALLAAGPVSEGCRRLRTTALNLARAHVMQAEGVDLFSSSMITTGAQRAAASRTALGRLPRDCSRGPAVKAAPALPELTQPRSHEAFAGRAEAPVPPRVHRVDVLVGKSRVGRATLTGGRAFFDLKGKFESRNIEFRFQSRDGVVRRARSTDVWLLPKKSERHQPARRVDSAVTRRLAQVASGFDGQAAIWIHDLSSGATAGWNEDALFPAASTVKIGVLMATLERFGPKPEHSGAAYELRSLTGWSSNLAANRLVRILGNGSTYDGSRVVEATLHRLGAASSYYPGEYLVGTALAPGALVRGAPDPPPRVSSRVTSARDLGRVLYLLDAAAMGSRSALRRTRLSAHEARIGLRLLLECRPMGANAGLLRPSAGSLPIAQKNGWIRDALHTAAIVYTSRGPVVAVVLTYRPGISRTAALALGAGVMRAVRSISSSHR